MARDIDQIAQIKAYGVDLDKKRQIDLTFWAPDEAAGRYLSKHQHATRCRQP